MTDLLVRWGRWGWGGGGGGEEMGGEFLVMREGFLNGR